MFLVTLIFMLSYTSCLYMFDINPLLVISFAYDDTQKDIKKIKSKCVIYSSQDLEAYLGYEWIKTVCI